MRAERAPGRPADRGFSLVAVLTSVFLTGVLLIGVLGVFQQATLQHRQADATTRASMIAAGEIDRLYTLPPTSTELNAGTTLVTLDGNLVRRTHIVDNVPAPGAKTIKVTVQRGGASRGVTFVAIRAR